MIESNITQKLRVDLVHAGFDVDKIADQFVAGIPDLTVSKNKCTGFYEVKLFKDWVLLPCETTFSFGSRLRLSPQVTNMCSKQVHAWRASYLIFFGTGHTLAEVAPIEIKKSLINRQVIHIRVQEYKTWLTTLVSSYSR